MKIRLAIVAKLIPIIIILTKPCLGEDLEPCPNLTVKDTRIMHLDADAPLILARFRSWVKFLWVNRGAIDITLYFGVFIAKVLVKVANRYYGYRVDLNFRKDMMGIITKLEDASNFYTVKCNEDKRQLNNKERKLQKSFMYDTIWMFAVCRTGMYYDETWPYNRREYVNTSEYVWQNYTYNVYEFKAMTPTPFESERCLLLFSEIPLLYPNWRWQKPCKFDFTKGGCDEMMINGTSYGFALTHRILLFSFLHHARYCTFYRTFDEDLKVIKFLCNRALHEAKFSLHPKGGWKLELLLEQMAFCGGMYWMSNFFIHKWVTHVLKYQTRLGCFRTENSDWNGHYIKGYTTKPGWLMRREYFDFMLGRCNRHITALAGILMAGLTKHMAEQGGNFWNLTWHYFFKYLFFWG